MWKCYNLFLPELCIQSLYTKGYVDVFKKTDNVTLIHDELQTPQNWLINNSSFTMVLKRDSRRILQNFTPQD